MIILPLKNGQGLGNQLWNIASAYGISKKLGLEFYIENYELFKAKNFINFENFCVKRQNISPVVESIHIHEESFFDIRKNILFSGFDKALYGKISSYSRPVYLHGLLQSEDYFIDSINLKTFFTYSNKFLTSNLPSVSFSDTCILNIRGGEYKKYSDFILPRSYWLDSIGYMQKMFNLKKFLIVTDDIHYSKSLFSHIPVISGSIFDCYLALYKAKYIISSNSTFSYFPIATSNSSKKYVIGPKYWSQFNASDGEWLSPCNIYRGWNWMNHSGQVESYEQCLTLATSTYNSYNCSHNIRINDYIQLHKSKIPLSSCIPKSFKRLLISMLRPWFPNFL